MSNEITNIKIDMAKLQKDVSYTKEKVENIEETLKAFIKSADHKYASKLTEKIVYGICGVILLAVLACWVSFIIK